MKEVKRRNELIKSQNLEIQIKPELLAILKMSNAVSTQKGESYFLGRPPKVTQAQTKIQILEKEKKKAKIKMSKAHEELEILYNKVKFLEEKEIIADIQSEKLSKLIETRIINQDCDLVEKDME